MGRPTKKERTCPECDSTDTYRVGYKKENKFVPLPMRKCLGCDELLYERSATVH